MKRKYITIGVGLLLIVALTAWIASGYPRQSVLDEQIAAAKEKIDKEYNDTIIEKEKKISELKQTVVASEKKYASLMEKYNRLEKEKINVPRPTSDKELRERFGALGYTVVDCPGTRAK